VHVITTLNTRGGTEAIGDAWIEGESNLLGGIDISSSTRLQIGTKFSDENIVCPGVYLTRPGMSLRKLEICIPSTARSFVLKGLQEKGGLGGIDHVGENIVCVECENCTKIEFTCTQARAGQLLTMLTTKYGVGVDYGTITSLEVASCRPHPRQLLDEFLAAKKKLQTDYDPKEENSEPAIHKFKYVQSTTQKSVEELWNEIVDLSIDNRSFYTSLCMASIIASVGLLTNSAVVVLSAMLISPLMGPILSGAFALAIRDRRLLKQAVLAECRAALATFLCGCVCALLFGTYFSKHYELPTAEMEGRSTPQGLVSGCIIALASGVVIGNAVTQSGVNSLVGVAISASLLPPIVNSGILFTLFLLPDCETCDRTVSPKQYLIKAAFSFGLYALNFAIILGTACIVFMMQHVGEIGNVLSNSSMTLDLGNMQVVQKIKIASGFSKWDDIEMTKITPTNPLPPAPPIKKDSSRSSSPAGVPGETSELLENGEVDPKKKDSDEKKKKEDEEKEQFLAYKARADLKAYSCFRPFDEPSGVATPEFASGQAAIGLYTRIRRAWGFAPLPTKSEAAAAQAEKEAKDKFTATEAAENAEKASKEAADELRKGEEAAKEKVRLEHENKEAALSQIDHDIMESLSGRGGSVASSEAGDHAPSSS
jgi:uncharacterized hydrophobic protein (TIGR00271 family)